MGGVMKRYPKYKESDVDWIGKIPEHWEVRPVYVMATLRNGYPFKSELFEKYGAHADRLIRIRDLLSDDERIFTREQCPVGSLAFNGDVLIGMDGDFNVHRWVRGPAKLNQRMCALRGRNDSITQYLHYALPQPLRVINELAYATTVKHLSSYEVLHLHLPIPPMGEMSLIVRVLDCEVARIDALIEKKARFVELLKEKRQAVITHAVTKGLDPNVKLKDSGVEWIGDVPGHWTVPKLRHVATVQTGTAKGKDVRAAETVLIPYLRVANVQDGYLDLSDVAQIEISKADLPRYLLRTGDVLMNEGGDNDKLGRGHIWRGEIDPCIHQNHVFAVRPHLLSSEWLNAYTGSSSAQAFFMSMAKQTTNLASISSSNLMDLPVPRPSDEEQASILTYTKAVSARIDVLIIKTECSIALLKERRAALITDAVTGQIDLREEAA